MRRLGHRAGGPEGLAFAFVELDRVREHLGDSALVGGVTLTPALIRSTHNSTQDLVDVALGPLHQVLGLRPLLGRLLTMDDDQPGRPRVVVLAEHFWRTHLGASGEVLGQHLIISGLDYVVVGVAPTQPSLGFFGVPAAAGVPAATADSLLVRNWRTDAAHRPFVALVRMPSVENRAAIDGRLARAAAALAADLPDRWRDRQVTTSEGRLVTGSLRRTSIVIAALLSAMAALVLVVAATNVGGLVFAQAAARRRANAIRVALGAGQRTILVQTIAEGLALGLGGGALSLLLYWWFASAARAIAILPTIVLRLDLPIDAAVIGLTLLTSLAAAVLTTLMPAVWASRTAVTRTMDSMAVRQTGDHVSGRARRWLLWAQLAASVVLIVFAAVFARSLDAIEKTPLGVDVDRLAAFDFDIEPVGVAPEALPALADLAMTRVRTLPGVASIAMADRAPIDPSTPAGDVRFRGASGDVVLPDVTRLEVTSGYFETVGLPLLEGRTFTTSDIGRPVAIVNETLARRLAGGRTIHDLDSGLTLEVLGVARDSKYRAIAEAQAPHFYRPARAQFHMVMLVRTEGNPAALFQPVQQALDAIGPGVQGFFPRTGRDHLKQGLLGPLVSAGLARVLGGIAGAMAALGLFGLLAWLIQMRRAEMGLRLALGASPGDLQRLVVGQAFRHAWPGVAAGIAIAALMAWAIRSQLFGVTALDPIVLTIAAGSLLAIVAIASWLPARQAGRVSAVELLR